MNENEENNEGRVSFFISLLTNSQLFTKKFPLTFIWNKCLVSFFFFFFFLVFLGLQPWRMEVPRPVVKWEL